MKKKTKHPFIVVMLLLFGPILLFYCSPEEEAISANGQTIALFDNSAKSPLTLAKNEAGNWDFNSKSEAEKFIIRKFRASEKRVTSLEGYEIRTNPETGNIASITFTGYDADGKAQTVGINIEKSQLLEYEAVAKGSTVYVTATTHSCSGNPCGCCAFAYTSGGNIKGCFCDHDGFPCNQTENGKCNHTVTSPGEA